MFPSSYFPATYFPPTDFPSGLEIPVYRDEDAYDAILAALIATGEFDAVLDAAYDDADAQATAGMTRVAILAEGGRRASEMNDGSPLRVLRLARYRLDLQVEMEERGDAYRELDRLYAIVSGAGLKGVSLGGFTIPRYSTLQSDGMTRAAHPVYTRSIDGQFGWSYVVSGGLRTTP